MATWWSCVSIFGLVLLTAINSCSCQETGAENATSCVPFYLHTQRQGLFLNSRLKIPVSKYTRLEDADTKPGFRLEISLSRSVRAVNIRQARGRDLSNHRKFMIDTVPKGDEMKIDTTTILQTIWSPNPRITRIILNDKHICGQPLTPSEANQTIEISAATRKKYHSVKKQVQKVKQELANENDEEDY